MEQGVVKFFLPEKGFGFIEYEGGELFFHATNVNGKQPKKLDKVSFNIGEGKRGEVAVDVEVNA